MKPGRGKNKGNAFENLVARKLSLWLTKGMDKTQLIPSRLSGGWQDRKWRHAGDLAPNGPVGEKFREVFVVECKHRKTELLWALFNTPGENVQGWWSKLVDGAQEVGRLPLLVFRQNQRGILVGLSEQVANEVISLAHSMDPSVPVTALAYITREEDWMLSCTLIPWSLLEAVDWEMMRPWCKRLLIE